MCFSESFAGGRDGQPGGTFPVSPGAFVAEVGVFSDEPGVTVGEKGPGGLAVAVSEDIDRLSVVGVVGAAVVGETASGTVSHVDQMAGLFHLRDTHGRTVPCGGQIAVVAH